MRDDPRPTATTEALGPGTHEGRRRLAVFLTEVARYDVASIEAEIERGMEALELSLEGRRTALLKPNIVMAANPRTAIVTNPVVVEAVVNVLRRRGFKEIAIADGPGVGLDVDNVFRVSGYRALADRLGVGRIARRKPVPQRNRHVAAQPTVPRPPQGRPARVRVPLVLAHPHEVDEGGAVGGGNDRFGGPVVVGICGIRIPLGFPGFARSVVALGGHLGEALVPGAHLLADVPAYPYSDHPPPRRREDAKTEPFHVVSSVQDEAAAHRVPVFVSERPQVFGVRGAGARRGLDLDTKEIGALFDHEIHLLACGRPPVEQSWAVQDAPVAPREQVGQDEVLQMGTGWFRRAGKA